MSHYAHVVDGIVQSVIAAEEEFVQSNPPALGKWIQTSYNTHAGVHTQGGTPLRKNFAAPGYSYDAELDAFVPPRPFDSWILDSETAQWQPPWPAPDDDNMYAWDPTTANWKIYSQSQE
jgi:hypothetical protein